MRHIWTGTIGFGLVNIPVKLFSVTKGNELNLDMLDKKGFIEHTFYESERKNRKRRCLSKYCKGLHAQQ